MMRILGGWIALTPELDAKLLLGRHVWDCAQHADLWGRRLPELRAPAQRSEPASAAVVRFMELLESPDAPTQTVERLAGVYTVLKPHLVAVYERHLATANAVYEPPTRRILERAIAEERRHAAAGGVLLARLGGVAERVERWRARLLASLAEAGGVTGDAGAPPLTAIAPDAAVGAQDLVAVPASAGGADLPPDLRDVLARHAAALVAGDLAGALADVAAGARDAARTACAGLPPGALATARVVAVARIGRYRVTKLRLEGRGVAAIIQERWVPADDGWHAAAVDVVRVEASA